MSADRNSSQSGRRFTPGVESLENRTVPAGNVQAFVSGHVLYVAGDDAANRIWIAGSGKTGVVIRSLDGETTINGRNAVFVGGITGGYHVTMGGGDDYLLVTSTRSNGGLTVDMGEGNDYLGISDAGHARETVLAGGEGNDTIVLHASTFRRPVYVNTGAGHDQVVAAGVRAGDFVMTNPSGTDFFDNRGAALGRATVTGFLSGMFPPEVPSLPVVPVVPPASPPVVPPTSPPASPPPPVATNTAPVAADDTASGAEDGGPVTGNVLTNDTDADLDTLTVSAVNGSAANVGSPVAVTGGAVTVLANGSFTFAPAANFNGVTTFTYTANDGTADSNTATVTITITPVADLTAVDDAFSTPEDTQFSASVAANDSTTSGGTLTYALTTGVANGTLVFNAGGLFTYTPHADFNGTDSFTYTVTDAAAGESATQTVTITVTAVNDAPVNTVPAAQTRAAGSTAALAGISVTDVDAGTGVLTVTVSVPAGSGTFTGTGFTTGDGTNSISITDTLSAVNAALATLQYAAPATAGAVTVTVLTSDNGNTGTGGALTATDTFTVSVTAGNSPPVAVDDTASGAEDAASITGNVLTNDTDADLDTLTVSAVNGSAVNVGVPVVIAGGTVTVLADGSFTFVPAPDFNGTVTFTYTANDGTADSNTATVTITVTPVNDPPVAMPVSGGANEDGPPVTLTASFTDPDAGDTFTFAVDTTGTLGSVVNNGDGTFTYDPNGAFEYLAAGETATDTFTYTVTDAGGASSSATVTVTITGQNDAPTANDDTAATDPATAIDVPVLANDTDPDATDTLMVVAVDPVSTQGAAVTIKPNGTIHYDPVPSAALAALPTGTTVTDTFTYTIDDGHGGTATATVTVTVTA